MKTEENKFAFNRNLTNKDQNKNQLTETIYEIPSNTCLPADFEFIGVKRQDEYKYACVDVWKIMGRNHELYKNDKYFSLVVTSCQEWSLFKIFEHKK